MAEYLEVPGIDSFEKDLKKKVTEVGIEKYAYPSALSQTHEEYIEFRILIPLDANLAVASTYIAETIKNHFNPASKYVYWRINPETELIKPQILENGVLKTREFIKLYTRLLITDKEETHRAVLRPFRYLEPIEPPTE